MSKGLKRICMNCGMRFYDMDKDPIICPSCGTEFTGEIKVKSRRGRTAAVEEVVPAKEPEKKAAETEDEIDDIDADNDIVSLDDVDEEDDLDSDDDDADDNLIDPDLDDDLDDLNDIDDDLEEEDDDDEDEKA